MKKSFLWGIGLGLFSLTAPTTAHAQFPQMSAPSNSPALQQNSFRPTSFPVPAVNAGSRVSVQGYNTTPAVQTGWVGPSNNQVRLVQNSVPGTGANHQHVPLPSVGDSLAPVQQNAVPSIPSLGSGAASHTHVPGCGCAACSSQMSAGSDYGNQMYGQPSYDQPIYQQPGLSHSQIYSSPQNHAPHAQEIVYGGTVGPQGFRGIGTRLGKPMRFGGNASHWFGGVTGLAFNRIDDQKVRLSNNSNMPTDPFLRTSDARVGTAGGVQFTLGKYFNCGRNAIAMTYWGLFPDENSLTVTQGAGGNLRSELPFTTLGPGGGAATLHGLTMPGDNVYDWYDGAAAHRIRRNYEVNNLEISLLGFGLGGAAAAPGSVGNCLSCLGGPGAGLQGACCSRLRLGWSAGVRWFRFNDFLEYATSDTDTVFGNTADDVYYRNDVTNDLVGFQLGSQLAYCLTDRVNLYMGSRFGVYGNHMQYDTYVGNTTTAATILAPGSTYDTRPFDYDFSRTDVAFLGEIDAGLAVRVTKCWSANFGYRALGASGIATAVGQIPQSFARPDDFGHINNTSSLILHGAYFGATCNF